MANSSQTVRAGMNGHDIGRRTRPLVWLATVGAVLAMTPITVFAAAAVGRLRQPLPNEPAGTEQRIFDWFAGLPAGAIATTFIVLPVLAARWRRPLGLLAGGR